MDAFQRIFWVFKKHLLWPLLCILFFSIFIFGCERDPDLAERELFIYLAVCPGSISQCQSECNTSSDISGNGIIEGPEEQIYNTCVTNCRNACAQPFLFYLLTDEGN